MAVQDYWWDEIDEDQWMNVEQRYVEIEFLDPEFDITPHIEFVRPEYYKWEG